MAEICHWSPRQPVAAIRLCDRVLRFASPKSEGHANSIPAETGVREPLSVLCTLRAERVMTTIARARLLVNIAASLSRARRVSIEVGSITGRADSRSQIRSMKRSS
jgi:hypothetical protein